MVVSSGKQSFQLSNYIGRKSTDVIAELKQKKVPENLIKIEEEESSESEEGTVLRQSPSAGTTYDLSKASTITLTIAKKVTSVAMPSYIGSSLEFTKNNLVQIVGIKEANIEVVEVTTAPSGTAEGTVVEQSPRAGEKVDLNKTRIKISIYKPKTPPSTSSAPAQRGNQGSTTTPSQGNQQGNQRGDTHSTNQSSSEGSHENSRN